VKTNIRFLPCLAQFFLEWEMFRTKFIEKTKIFIACSIFFFFFRKSCRLRDNVETYSRAGQATGDMALALGMLDTKGYKHTLIICDTYYFYTAVMVTRTRLNIYVKPTLLFLSFWRVLSYSTHFATCAVSFFDSEEWLLAHDMRCILLHLKIFHGWLNIFSHCKSILKACFLKLFYIVTVFRLLKS
jgi:hypothetical protein